MTPDERNGLLEDAEWKLIDKGFIQYRKDATLVAIPAPITGYFAGVIKHVGGAYIMPPVDFELSLTGAMKRAEHLYLKNFKEQSE